MASTINATTSGVVTTGDSVATLSLQTGGTTAVAIDSAQIVSLSKSLALLGSSSGSVALAAPATAGTQSYTLPTAQPTADGLALTATKLGAMSWAAASATPAGSDTQVQYNSSGTAFGASSSFTFASGTGVVTATGFSGALNGTVGATTPAAGTFTTATARAAATQDSVVLQGRAGGTSSYAATITPTTLTASRTVTLPDANINFATGLPVANGGTGLTSGTSGGVPYFSGTSAISSSAALTQYGIVYGGGAGAAPVATAVGTTGQFLGANTGGAPTWQTPSGGGSAATPAALGTVYAITSPGSGAYSSGLGYNALGAITSGVANTGVGNAAGSGCSSGVNNVYIGNSAGTVTIVHATGNGCTYVGANSTASSTSVSSEMVIQSGAASSVGKGASTGFFNANGGSSYNGANSAAWAVTSDQRLKKNIVDNNVGLDAINAVRVRNFEYRLPEEIDSELSPNDAIVKSGIQLGVIAQELQAVLPDCVKQESTGVLSVDSDPLTWHMINAIKQLSAALDAANARIAALEAK